MGRRRWHSERPANILATHCFSASALAFACYTVAMRRARLNGVHTAAISAVGSMLIYMPPYTIVAGAGLFDPSPSSHRPASPGAGSSF